MLTKSERYMAFLLTYLPRLQSVAVSRLDEKIPGRGIVLAHALDAAADRPGSRLEFGVYNGSSITFSANRYPDRKYYGFDSFEGFPNDGRSDWQQDFSVKSLPTVPQNVTLIKGWFSETLPKFLSETQSPVGFVHVDCDIYSSTVDIFSALHKFGHIKPGLVIAFDELINYHAYPWHEMLALFELLEETGLGIDWIAAHKRVRPIDETLHLVSSGSHPSWTAAVEDGYWTQAALVLTDAGIDYSILRLPHVATRVKKLAMAFDAISEARTPRLKTA